MNKLIDFRVISAAIALVAAVPVSAATIVDFNDKAPISGEFQQSTEPYVAADGTIVSTPGGVVYPGTLYNADPIGTTYTPLTVGATTTVTFTGPVNLISVDLTDAYNSGICGILPGLCVVNVTINYSAGGFSSEDLTLGAALSSFNLTTIGQGAASFTLAGESTFGYTLDNIAYTGSQVVPEPATWTMLVIGAGAVGTMLRRRRAAADLKPLLS